MVAAKQGHAEIVKILLAAGAEVDAKEARGGTALMMAAQLQAVQVQVAMQVLGLQAMVPVVTL